MSMRERLRKILEEYFEYLQENICTPECTVDGCASNCTSNYEIFSEAYRSLEKEG